MSEQQLSLSPFQTRALQVPESIDLFLGGGRGGGKTWAKVFLIVRYAEQHGGRVRILWIRKTYKGLSDVELILREVLGTLYGTEARFNASEHVVRLPNGAYIELGCLDGQEDYAKYQGRSFNLLIIDEAQQYATPELLDMLRSNLRGPADVPIRVVIAANPGGVGHYWLAKRYVFQAAPWKPFFEAKSKRTWVYAPSTFIDNPHIDRDSYRDQLTAACPEDPELLRAWLVGDWAIARGAYFGTCLDEHRNAVDPDLWNKIPKGWRVFLAHDWGSTAPSCTFLVAEAPGGEKGPDGRYYAAGSLILVDELATHRRDDLSKGLGWTAATLAEEIKTMWSRWSKSRPEGVADDACFAKSGHSSGSIADEFRLGGVYFLPARKADRISGWQRMKRLLSDAGKPDVPGLYISRACTFFWSTVPTLARDQRRVEDLDSAGIDHAADACRYGVLQRGVVSSSQKVRL